MDDEKLRLVAEPKAVAVNAERLFRALQAALTAVLPAGAIIEHIGATAVPGCETKGDLDLVIRVAAEDFPHCRSILDARFAPNTGSIRNEFFAAFVNDAQPMPVGIQLVVVGSELDDFTGFRDRLRSDPQLVEAYNVLKRSYAGRSTEAYRAAKNSFIADVMATRQHPISQPPIPPP